jgi:uracil-DNA glycosylase
MLFLFEKPGPMTDPEGGSGFISRNNDDATAEAAFRFMLQAGIDRKDTVLWNVIPGWNKTIQIEKGELEQGRSALKTLLTFLPNLRVVVLVGRKAAQVQADIEERGLKVFVSHHPSPKVRAIYRDKWDSIPSVWAAAGEALGPLPPDRRSKLG